MKPAPLKQRRATLFVTYRHVRHYEVTHVVDSIVGYEGGHELDNYSVPVMRNEAEGQQGDFVHGLDGLAFAGSANAEERFLESGADGWFLI